MYNDVKDVFYQNIKNIFYHKEIEYKFTIISCKYSDFGNNISELPFEIKEISSILEMKNYIKTNKDYNIIRVYLKKNNGELILLDKSLFDDLLCYYSDESIN